MHRTVLTAEEIAVHRASGAVLLWHYARVSTPNDQKPERQLEIAQEWIAGENVGREARGEPPLVLVGTTWERGASGQKTWALKKMEPESADPVREGFPKACASAKANGCTGILVEEPDRFSRRDPEEAIWERMEVRRDFGLRIWSCDLGLAEQSTSFGGVIRHFKATKAHDDVVQLAPRVATGIETRRGKGEAVGGQTQAKVDDKLVALVQRLKAEHPRAGFRVLARLASDARGAFRVTPNSEAYRARLVSHMTVKRILEGSTWHQRKQRGVTRDQA